MLDDSSVSFTLKPAGKDIIALDISVSGNSPVDIDLWSIIPENLPHEVRIRRIHQNKPGLKIAAHGFERLFPGKAVKAGNVLQRADFWATIAFGKEHLEASALHYRYQIEGLGIADLVNVVDFSANNAITGKVHQLHQLSQLADNADTQSVHPWDLADNTTDAIAPVILSGDINILQDTVYAENQPVQILPGAVFKIAKGRSLVFYGKVTANGAKHQPIRFMRKIADEPWGSVIIQGRAASGSELRHIEVSGGSVSTQRLVDYPGQLNIHDVDSFQLEHCVIKDNVIGDDALHIAYSSGSVANCDFENTAFDALDMDIVDVSVSDSRFFNIGNDAIDLMTSRASIQNIAVSKAGDKCLSVGEHSDITLKNSELMQCYSGIAVKDESRAYLEGLIFRDMETAAIALYRKNPRYGSGGAVSGRLLRGITLQDIDVSDGVSTISSADLLPVNH